MAPVRVAHDAPSPSGLRPGAASHGPALHGTLPSAACSLHLGQVVLGRCQPEDVHSPSNSSAHRRETRKAPGLPGGWEQSGDCETTFVSSMEKDHDCLGQTGPKGRGWREMLRLPLPLLSANRMRRNTDVSQEKGVKQECFTFQRNQADKKEGRRKPAKLSTSVTLGERAWTRRRRNSAPWGSQEPANARYRNSEGLPRGCRLERTHTQTSTLTSNRIKYPESYRGFHRKVTRLQLCFLQTSIYDLTDFFRTRH